MNEITINKDIHKTCYAMLATLAQQKNSQAEMPDCLY